MLNRARIFHNLSPFQSSLKGFAAKNLLCKDAAFKPKLKIPMTATIDIPLLTSSREGQAHRAYSASPPERRLLSAIGELERTAALFCRLLPEIGPLEQLKRLDIGTANRFWKIISKQDSYLLRQFKKPIEYRQFRKIAHVAQAASSNFLGPEVLATDGPTRSIVMKPVDTVTWPRFEIDSIPYFESMRALRAFHNLSLNTSSLFDPPDQLYPFHFIATKCTQLFEMRDIPRHFFVALKSMIDLFERTRPWLEANATVYHGDFQKDNILLTKELDVWGLQMIGFDYCEIGHPFYDVAKFCIGLTREQRHALFIEYLGKKQPTLQEKVHLEINHFAYLMIVAIVCFQTLMQKPSSNEDPRLTRAEMEKMLDSEDQLPPFTSILKPHNTSKQRQLGAIYAIGELVRKIEHLPA